MPSDPIEKLREFGTWWMEFSTSEPDSFPWDDYTLDQHAQIVGVAKAAWRAALNSQKPALEQQISALQKVSEALTTAIMCIEDHMDTPGTEFDSGKECKSVASFVDDWRAALNPTP